MSEPPVLRRPARPRHEPRNPERWNELRRLVIERDRLDAAIELQRMFDSDALDRRLVEAGYMAAPLRRRWPRQREQFELTGQRMVRGPWLGGAWARNTVRIVR